MSNRWQLLGGITLQQHEGFHHSGTFTESGRERQYAQHGPEQPELPPEQSRLRDLYRHSVELRNLSGSYQFPYGVAVLGQVLVSRRRAADAHR